MDRTLAIECVLPVVHNETKWSGYYSPVWGDDRWRIGVTSAFLNASIVVDLSRRDEDFLIADFSITVKCDDTSLYYECEKKRMFVGGSRAKICDLKFGSSTKLRSPLNHDRGLVQAGSLRQWIAQLEESNRAHLSFRKFVQINIKIVYRGDSPMKKGYECSSSASLQDDIVSYTASSAGLECADVELIGSDGSVYTHSFLLKSRSYIMMTLIEYHTIDGHESVRIKFPTVPKDVLEDLVSFIERDTVPNLAENAMDLFILADQYYLRKLKSICEKYLANAVNDKNASQLQLLCDTVGSPLISAALNRIQGSHSGISEVV